MSKKGISPRRVHALREEAKKGIPREEHHVIDGKGAAQLERLLRKRGLPIPEIPPRFSES